MTDQPRPAKPKLAIIGIRGIPANYGGFETCAEETATRLTEQFDVHVFCRAHSVESPTKTYRGVRLVTLPSINSKSLDTLSHTFLCVLYLMFRPDIRLVHLYNTANALFIPWLKLFGKRTVISVDGLEWKRQKWGAFAKRFIKVSERLAVKWADCLVADSRVVQDYYKAKFGVDSKYIPYGANLTREVNEETLGRYDLDPRGYLLFVGRLVPEKGVHNLIEAYNRVQTDMPLVIVGDDAEHREYIASLKESANTNVRFLGFVYGDDYLTLNHYPYMYVTASLLEGTSPALVTAMGMGNCCLVNGTAENRETIGSAGIAYQENSVEDCARSIQELLAEPEKVREVGKSAAQRVAQVYNWDKVATAYAESFSS